MRNWTEVDEIYMREPNWDFDIVRVIKDNDGRHYWGRDSGCSCPTPFEDFGSLEDWNPIDIDRDMDGLIFEISDSSTSIADQNSFVATVRDSMRLSGKSVLR